MTKLLLKIFVKDYEKDVSENRDKIALLSGFSGIFCNVMLCVGKFIVGTVTNSVSITGDALNNLSDAGSNIFTIAGTKLASKPVDEEHPFGHGRMEYISSLIISFFIFLMGFELGKSSIDKILHPQSVKFSLVSLFVLIAAVGVKLWMAVFNNRLYKITGNVNMKAVSRDSLNDCLATGATIAALLISHFTSFKYADGIMGLIVTVFIILAGIDILKDVLGSLLGKAPDPELVKSIEDIMLSNESIVGVHDLIVHDYGPGRIIASAHAEVPCDCDILEIHDVIDNVEKEISLKLNIIICIHMDPIAVNDEVVDKYKEVVDTIVKDYNTEFSFHDFRMVKGNTHTNLIFDLTVPHSYRDKSKITKDICARISNYDSTLNAVITVEHTFI